MNNTLLCIVIIQWLLFGIVKKYEDKQWLSEYSFFVDLPSLTPNAKVYPYELNTPLFTDYASKSRFIYVPDGKVMNYNDSVHFDLPVGTVLIKNFFYPLDFQQPEKGRRLIETRLLLHAESGWRALPYQWNEEQTDAFLSIGGGRLEVGWRHHNGKKRRINYLIPTINQCKGCHSKNKEMQPIGIAARHLNRDKQLEKWSSLGLLQGLPDTTTVPANADWSDEDASIDTRTRAWLDINCAHCHDQGGPASNTGLYLSTQITNPTLLGIYKAPVAAGNASESLDFDIVPGKPKESILLARMITNEVGQRMPEIGRTTVDEEAVALIRQWIKEMK